MAVNYAFPPHIANVPNPGEQFARGLTLGVNIQQQREQLAAQREAAAMQAAVRQRELEQEAIRDRQKLMVEQAYQESAINLRKQQLDIESAKVAMDTEQAARRFAAQQLYQRRVAAGEDAAKVLLELGPSLGESLTGVAQLYRAANPPQVGPPEEVTYGGQKFLKIPQASGASRFQQIQVPTTTPEGPLQARAVIGPDGKPIPGVFATPGSSGGLLPHNIPGDRYQNLSRQLDLMEKSAMGRYLVSGRPPTDKSKLADYEKAKAKYDSILSQMEHALQDSPVTAVGTAPQGPEVIMAPGQPTEPMTIPPGIITPGLPQGPAGVPQWPGGPPEPSPTLPPTMPPQETISIPTGTSGLQTPPVSQEEIIYLLNKEREQAPPQAPPQTEQPAAPKAQQPKVQPKTAPEIGSVRKGDVAGTVVWNGSDWISGPANPKKGDTRNFGGVQMVFIDKKWQPYGEVQRPGAGPFGKSRFAAADVGRAEGFFRPRTTISAENRYTGEFPPAPVNPKDREFGAIYWTPMGPMQWQSRGWLKPT